MLNSKNMKITWSLKMQTNNAKRLSQIFCIAVFIHAISGCATIPDSPAGQSALHSESNEQLNIAISLLKSNKLAEARTHLTKILKTNPGSLTAKINMGILLIRTDEFDKAESLFNEILQEYPDNTIALNYLGIISRSNGKFDEAKIFYERAIKSKPDYAYAYLNLGILNDLYLYQPGKAIENYKKYLTLLKQEDKTVSNWIVELERRHAKK